MKNKAFLTIGLISLLVLGLAAPAGAATLKDSKGEAVKSGSVVTLTAATLTATYPGTPYSTVCNNVVLEYQVEENGPQISLFPGTITRGSCLFNGTTPVTLISTLFYTPLELSAGEGSASYQFKEKFGSALTCTFTGAFEFTYEAGTDVLSVPGSTLAGEGFGCPTSEVVQGNFALTNKLGKVTIN